MERKLRVAQIGTGKMSVYTMRYVYEKGAEIVAALDVNPNVIGKDIGEIIGSDNKGVVIGHMDNAREILTAAKPDVAIVTTMSLIADLDNPLTLCAELGINAITTCEEAFYPANSNPALTNKLDEIAVPDAAPETMSLYLFPLDGGKSQRYEFTDFRGGRIRVKAGEYQAICLNSDTRNLRLEDIDRYVMQYL